MNHTREAQNAPWHAMSTDEVLAQLHTRPSGLHPAEAEQRLRRHGPNTLPEREPPGIPQIFLRQFRSPLIYVLMLAAAVSLAIAAFKDAGFIAAVLLLNAVIGAWQEWSAEQRSQALRKMLRIRAAVERDGEVIEIPAEELVPGDIVWLESGNRVPADLRLLAAHGLEVDESLLTGESLPVLKNPDWPGTAEAPLADRQNMAHAASIVTRGRAKGAVIATGHDTAVGQLALDVVAAESGKPPLIARMEKFSKTIAIYTLLAAIAIGALALLLGRYSLADVFMFIVALAVSTIPEGLPVAITVVLAIATTRMVRRGVIVRRLSAVEGLGSCTLIATDKTGTLTANELTVREVFLPHEITLRVTGEGFTPEGAILQDNHPPDPPARAALEALARAAALCNEASLHHAGTRWDWHGDAVDIALLALAHKAGLRQETELERLPEINKIPFEPEHRYAATFHADHDKIRVFVKGAPERVLAMCAPDDRRPALEATALDMAQRGLRVLALAEGDGNPAADPAAAPPEPAMLRLLGFVGMIDPLRPGAREAVHACHQAGINVAMITGDHQITALAIARDLGLAQHTADTITGEELARVAPAELPQTVQRVRVYARVAPRQKLEIVEAAQRAGHFVAVTGDGVNDAPALRKANVGIAMGKAGTDVAREAAELVISDDNFATIVAGIEEGRIAYDNIRNVVFLLISTGAAELVMVMLAVGMGLPLPLLPVQLLWLNLVTNGIQHIGLAFEPGDPAILRRKPRPPHEAIFNRLMIERVLLGAISIGIIAFAAFYWMLAQGWTEHEARNTLLLLMVLFENFHLGNCRSETRSAFALSPLRSPMLLLGVLGAFAIHFASMHLPFMNTLLGVHPVSIETWLCVLLLAAMIVPIFELHKALRAGSPKSA